MESNLAQKAISLAVSLCWDEAIKINLEILSDDKNNIDALNRLAWCYYQIGKVNKAIESTKSVLQIDPVNAVALRCLNKYKNASSNKTKTKYKNFLSSECFLEESGKTRIVNLINLGDKKGLINLEIGQEVKMITHTHKVSVVTTDNKYIGKLPDDFASLIKKLTESGNKFCTLIKSPNPEGVQIFIKETIRKTKNASFPPEKIDYVPYAVNTQVNSRDEDNNQNLE